VLNNCSYVVSTQDEAAAIDAYWQVRGGGDGVGGEVVEGSEGMAAGVGVMGAGRQPWRGCGVLVLMWW
jgi:hypothetical protein